MSELRRKRRELRKVGKRIILNAYNRWTPGRLGIVSAPTCSGKTYNIQNELIPNDIEEGRINEETGKDYIYNLNGIIEMYNQEEIRYYEEI